MNVNWNFPLIWMDVISNCLCVIVSNAKFSLIQQGTGDSFEKLELGKMAKRKRYRLFFWPLLPPVSIPVLFPPVPGYKSCRLTLFLAASSERWWCYLCHLQRLVLTPCCFPARQGSIITNLSNSWILKSQALCHEFGNHTDFSAWETFVQREMRLDFRLNELSVYNVILKKCWYVQSQDKLKPQQEQYHAVWIDCNWCFYFFPVIVWGPQENLHQALRESAFVSPMSCAINWGFEQRRDAKEKNDATWGSGWEKQISSFCYSCCYSDAQRFGFV